MASPGPPVPAMPVDHMRPASETHHEIEERAPYQEPQHTFHNSAPFPPPPKLPRSINVQAFGGPKTVVLRLLADSVQQALIWRLPRPYYSMGQLVDAQWHHQIFPHARSDQPASSALAHLVWRRVLHRFGTSPKQAPLTPARDEHGDAPLIGAVFVTELFDELALLLPREVAIGQNDNRKQSDGEWGGPGNGTTATRQ